MWLERVTIRRLALFIFLNVVLFAFGEAQHISASLNVSSAILTESVSSSTPSLLSTVVLKNSLSINPVKIISTSKSKLVLSNSTAMKYATGPNSQLSEDRKKATTEVLSSTVKLTSSSLDYNSSSLQKVALNSTLIIDAKAITTKPPAATIPSTISGDYKTIWTNVSPNKSEISMAIKSSQSARKSLIIPVDGEVNVTNVGNKTKVWVNMASLKSMQSFVSPSASKVAPSFIPQVIGIANITASSFLRVSKSLKYSEVNSRKPLIHTNLTFATATFTGKPANMTMILKPSPSLITKQQRSNVETTSLSETVKRKVILYSKSSAESILFTGRNDTIARPVKTKLVLFTSNSLTTVNNTVESVIYKTIAKEKVTRLSSVPMLRSKNMTASPIQNIFNSKFHTPSHIRSVVNPTTIAGNISKPDQFSKIVSNQSQILAKNTIFGMIRPSTILSSFYNTLSIRTEEIAISPSMTIEKIPPKNETKLYSISKIKTSDMSEEKKQDSTASSTYIEKEFNTAVPTTLQPMMKEQQFLVTIMILSEKFEKEYLIKSSNKFKQKSREVEGQFKIVFQHMSKYQFMEVLKFFSGSLGCDLIIHTKSKESELVSVEEINDTLNKAKNTKGGFGKFVVGDVKVKEENTDVEGRNEEEKEEKETWGRIPIIVVSILGGVCFVLIVMVISQCIQRRHYSHSLADSNEIQEYSPAIHLKNNDDNLYKDEERVPMTTFNQTDIY